MCGGMRALQGMTCKAIPIACRSAINGGATAIASDTVPEFMTCCKHDQRPHQGLKAQLLVHTREHDRVSM